MEETTKAQLQAMRDEAIVTQTAMLVDQAARMITVSIIQRAKAGESTHTWIAGSNFNESMIESIIVNVRAGYPDIIIDYTKLFSGEYVIKSDWT